MARQQSIGIGVVGFGYWGHHYARIFSELPDVRVVSICDSDPGRVADAQRRFPGVATDRSLASLLRRPDLDAVVVCTPATTHYETARQALSAGKHLLVEKPLTTEIIQAIALTDAARAAGLTLMVGHTFLFNPAIGMVKELLSSGEAGTPYYMYARRTNLGPIRYDVNAAWDLAPHDVAIFNHLVGSAPVWVSAVGLRALRNHREDVAFIALGYPGDILAHIHVSWTDPHKVREVVVVGSRQRIVFSDTTPTEPVRIYHKGVEAIVDAEESHKAGGKPHFMLRDGDILSPHVPVAEPLTNQCMHFVHCLRTGEQPVTDGRSGEEVVRVMEAVDRSMEQGGVPTQVAPAGVPMAPAFVQLPVLAGRS